MAPAKAENGWPPLTPHRDWSALPHLALANIVVRLRGLADFHAFRRACRIWRVVAQAAEGDFFASLTPFLFCDFHLGLLCAAERRFYHRADLLRKGVLEERVVGCSHGHLILLSWQRPWILNPLTGAELRGFPCSPPNVLRAVVSSHPASPNVALVLFDGSAVRYCRLGDAAWSVLYKRTEGPEWVGCVEDVEFMGRKGYLLCTNGKLATFDLVASPELTRVECEPAPLENWNERAVKSLLNKSLVECDGELFLFKWGKLVADPARFLIFQFDAENRAWRGLEGLGGRALFISRERGGVLVDNRARWGGIRDAVYYIHMHNDILSVRAFRVARRDEETEPVFIRQFAGKGLSDFHGVWVVPSS